MSGASPPTDAHTGRGAVAWGHPGPTERDNLERELAEAGAARKRSLLWTAMVGVGPAAILAVALAAANGRLELAAGLFGLGMVVEGLRIRRLTRSVRELQRALQDPMDGS